MTDTTNCYITYHNHIAWKKHRLDKLRTEELKELKAMRLDIERLIDEAFYNFGVIDHAERLQRILDKFKQWGKQLRCYNAYIKYLEDCLKNELEYSKVMENKNAK